MKANIYHWYRGPVTYRVKDGKTTSTPEEIDDLEDWIRRWDGAVIVRPPSTLHGHDDDTWLICITDETNRFVQK